MTFNITQPLTQGVGKYSAKAQAISDAKSALTIQQKQQALVQQATILGVTESYFAAVEAQEEITVQQQALDVAEAAALDAKKRADAGLVAEIEVSRAEINVAETRDQLNTCEETKRTAMDALITSMGQRIGHNVELTDSVPEVDITLPPLPDAVETALHNRIELAIYDQQLADKQRQVEVAKDALKPAFNLVGNYTSTAATTTPSTSLLNVSNFNLGVAYTLTLDKRALKEQRNVSERDLALSTDLRKFEMDNVASEVRQSYRAVETAKNSVEILGKNLETAKQNLYLAQRMVDEGLSSNRDILDAQTSLTSLQSGLLTAKINLYLATINLMNAMGEDLRGFIKL